MPWPQSHVREQFLPNFASQDSYRPSPVCMLLPLLSLATCRSLTDDKQSHPEHLDIQRAVHLLQAPSESPALKFILCCINVTSFNDFPSHGSQRHMMTLWLAESLV